MSYIDGFVIAVPSRKRDEYLAMAAKAARVFKEYGATRIVEGWGDDVPNGTVTDFRGAVKAKEDEVVMFSWIEWPSKKVRDEGQRKMMNDPRMQPDAIEDVFDAKRMIYGGFEPLLDETLN